MSKPRLLLAFALLTGLIVSASAAKLNTRNLTGKIKGSVYIAPKELFRLPVPVDADLGGRVEDLYNKDGKGMVGFTDDVGHLYRVEYFELTPENARQIAELGEAEFFMRFLTMFYLPNTIWLAIPGSKVLTKDFSTEPDGPLLMTWNFLPKGSVLTVSRNGSKPEREDSYRTVALFIRKNLLFVVSLAPSSPQVGNFREKTPPDKLQATMDQTTREFIRKIETPKSAP